MNGPQLVELERVAPDLPFALGTLYNWHYARRVNWLTRHGPNGRRGRSLWVNVDQLSVWAQARGLRLQLAREGARH